MEIQHSDDGKKGMFFVEQEQEILARMTYVWSGADRIIIDHTEVDHNLRAKGLGKQLVIRAVEFAREKGIKIRPVCSFVAYVFDKEAEFRDVLYN